MSRLIRDTDIIRKLNNLIEAIGAEPKNARYDKAGLLKIVNAIIVAVEEIDEAYSVEAVVRELEECEFCPAIIEGAYCDVENRDCTECFREKVIEIVRGGRNG